MSRDITIFYQILAGSSFEAFKNKFIVTATNAGSKTTACHRITDVCEGASVSDKGKFAGWEFTP